MTEEIAVRKEDAIERLRTSLESIVTIRDEWIVGKKAELDRAIEAHKSLAAAGASETKRRYSRNRVALLRKVVNALEAGFVPIPRFTGTKINLDFEDLPLKALMAVSDAKATGLFDEIRLIAGSRPNVDLSKRGRDPMLVGIVKMPGAWVNERKGGYQTRWRTLPARQEHFLLAWWRPEDERDEDMW